MDSVEARLKRTRLWLGITQKDVSEATGVSRATLCRAEAGQHRLSGVTRDQVEAWLAGFATPTTEEP